MGRNVILGDSGLTRASDEGGIEFEFELGVQGMSGKGGTQERKSDERIGQRPRRKTKD
jgi:hypothetical protein